MAGYFEILITKLIELNILFFLIIIGAYFLNFVSFSIDIQMKELGMIVNAV